MATIGKLVVKLVADIGEYQRGMERAQNTVRKVSAGMRQVGTKMTAGVTMPLLGVAGAAWKSGESLDRGMANVASLGVAADRVQELKGGVQELALETGKSTGDMAQGLYQVVSAFGDSADTMAILEINAKAAAAGLATTEDAINLTSAVMKGYHETGAEAAQQAADLALKTVQLGQTTFPELAASMGSVVPIAGSLGAEQEELFAVMATLTGVTGSASEVSTQLRGAMQALMAPTTETQKLIASLGYESGEAMVEQLGLVGSFQTLVDAAEKTGQPLQKFIGSIEGQTLALALSGPQADVYGEKLAAMAEATGATAEAFKAQTQGVNEVGFRVQQARVKMEVFFQKIYSGLLPAFAALLDAVQPAVDWLTALADRFAGMDPKMQLLIAGAAGAVAALGPLLVIFGMIGSAVAAVMSPVGLLVGAVGYLAYRWVESVGGIRAAMQILQDKFTMVWGAVEPMVGQVVEFVTGKAGEMAAVLRGVLASFSWEDVKARALEAWAMMQGGWRQAVEFFTPTVERIRGAFGDFVVKVRELGPQFVELKDAIMNAVSGIMPLVVGLLAVLGVFIGNVIAALLEHISVFIGGMLEAFTGFFNLLGDIFHGRWGKIKDDVIKIGDGLWKALDGVMGFIYSSVVGTWEDITGDTVMSWTELKGKAVEVFHDVVEKIKDAFDIDWAGLGRSIIDGIINGIKAGVGGLMAAAANAANSALEAAKHAIIARSPSRRAEDEVGLPVPQGTAKGILKGVPLVERAARVMANRSIKAAVPAVGGGGRGMSRAEGSGGGPTLIYAPWLSMGTAEEVKEALRPLLFGLMDEWRVLEGVR